MDHWYIILIGGCSTHDIVTIAEMLGMHNSKQAFDYVEIWCADKMQIRKLCQILDILGGDFRLAKNYKFED